MVSKSTLSTAIVIADLARKGIEVFMPVSEGLPYDLVILKDDRFLKIQVKHTSSGKLKNERVFFKDGKAQGRPYEDHEFEYYAAYLPQVDKVIYPSIKFKGLNIRTTVPEANHDFWWYEDFLDFTDEASKKTRADFGLSENYTPRLDRRKAVWPTKAELGELLWQVPTVKIAEKFGVSDAAVGKWAKLLDLPKPPRGYWISSEENRKKLQEQLNNIGRVPKEVAEQLNNIGRVPKEVAEQLNNIGRVPKFCKAFNS